MRQYFFKYIIPIHKEKSPPRDRIGTREEMLAIVRPSFYYRNDNARW